ncbi:hypothetical protein M413DRAFT_444968 [Hebeloma cylindrosporum]|uniref:Uncharacterized protein n=1 Tax=Hebeloma cylindrosporum TaxID=76867 RepID=A0A0C2YL29_HEBCY|nr:hypothetical protein M413DRAFT_444968 [Hebeloma cylindrosporum h7]
MANIKIDSELMLHMMAAEPITSSRRFIAVRDSEHRPLLFSVTSEGQFVAIKSNGQGSNVQVNLGEILGLRAEVHAFVVTQSSNADGTLFIAFATKESANSSHLHVLKPIKPNDLNLSNDVLRSKLLLAVQQPTNARISELHMNPTTNTTPPLLVPVFHDVNGDLQIARIQITSTNWSWERDIAIPELAKSFIALRPGKLALGEGLFVLYKGGNKKPSLLFITTDDPQQTTTVDLGFPADAEPNSMSTFTDGKGFTGLFVAGNGLFLLNPKDCLSSGKIATKISSDPVYHDIENIFIAQAGPTISAWFETEDHSLGYQRATNDGKLVGDPTLLLPAGSNAEFAPIIDPSSTSQILVILDDNNQLSLLEQSIDSQVWTSTPFLVERREKMTQISAFMTHIEINDATKSPLALTSFTLSSSAWVSVLVNGVFRSIPVKGTPVKTDARGIITLVVPSQDMSCYRFTLRDVAGSSHLPSNGVTIDPSSKVAQRLSTIKTADDLKNFTSGNGKRLLDGCTASEQDIKNAAEALGAISNISFTGNNPPANTWHGPSPALTASVLHGSSSASVGGFLGSIIKTVKNALWDSWEWISRQVSKATEWLISKVNDAWNFVVTIAGKAWSFVLDGVNAVVKAAGFIFSKLKVAFDAVVDAFGFVFNWDDIKQTRDSIKVMVNSCFDFGSVFILNNKPTVAKVFDDMEKAILKGLAIDLPDDAKNKKHSSESANADQPEKADASTSAPANVGAYHFEQAKKSSSTLQKASSALSDAFDRIIKPVLQDLSEKTVELTADISKLFSAKDGVSVGEVLKILGAGILKIVIGLVKNIVLGLMEVASDILQAIKAVLDWKVYIDVVTPLLEWLDVPAFSLLDAVSLIFAMPITVLAKTITGKAPARIQSFDYSAMAAGKLDKPSLLAYNELASYLTITYSIFDTISKIVGITIGAVAEPPKALTLGAVLMKIIVQAATFPYDKASAGREWRIAVWSMLGVNEIIKAIALQTGLPVSKLIAATDIFIALSTFTLTQVVHGAEYKVNKSASDHAKTSLSLAESVYTVVAGVAGGYGTIAADPDQKTICAVLVAGSNANSAVVKTSAKVLKKSAE